MRNWTVDLSIIEQAFELRDEIRKIRLGDTTLDYAPLTRGEAARMDVPKELPDDGASQAMLQRAAALFAEAEKAGGDESAPKPDKAWAENLAALLSAAVAPLPVFDEAEFGSVEPQPDRETPPPMERPITPPAAVVDPDNGPPAVPAKRAGGGAPKALRRAAAQPDARKPATPKKRGRRDDQ